MTATTTDHSLDVPPMLEGFASMHAAMRRDAARLPDALRRADDAAARVLDAWYARFRHTIELHHAREDDTVWPVLAERSASFAAARPVLEDDHHVLDDALDATAASIAALVRSPTPSTRDAAVREAEALARILFDHLDREERAAFGELVRTFTPEEYGALEAQLLKQTPLRALAFEAPWALRSLPEEVQAARVAEAPVPLRLLYRFSFLPRYQRLVQRAGM